MTSVSEHFGIGEVSYVEEDPAEAKDMLVINGVLNIFRRIAPVVDGELSLVEVQPEDDSFDSNNVELLRILTTTKSGTIEREFVQKLLTKELRRWVKRTGLGGKTVEYPGDNNFPSTRVKPDSKIINTYFVIDYSDNRQAIVVVPSMVFPDRDKYLQRQYKIGRKIADWT